MNAPTIDECLTAAAYSILTDHYKHSRDAIHWAVGFLRRAARGQPTEFLRTLPRSLA
jgi:hypothetical protein